MKKLQKYAIVLFPVLFFIFSCEKEKTENVKDSLFIVMSKESLEMTVGDSLVLTAEVAPSSKEADLIWSSSNPEAVSVKEGVVTALKEGTASVTASVEDVSAVCKVIVNPLPAPKPGDYLYEDGTWSDGGLVSMDAGGLNPVWSEVKPAPKQGKKVIGIVFQTDQSRIAESDIADGYTNGYAVSVRFARSAEKPTTFWSTDMAFSCLKAAKLASTWYDNVNGRAETETVCTTYGDALEESMPAFYLTVNGLPFAVPEETSGWFLPSTGQLWDMVANLCGHEAAELMQGWQTTERDATWYCSEKVKYNAMEKFNETLSMIPEDEKDVLVENDSLHPFCSLWTSTPYEEESANIINIGSDGLIELMCDWYNADCFARPILAF